MTDQEVTSKEMITLLCMADRTHSQLIEMMPEKCGLTGQVKDIEPTLRQVIYWFGTMWMLWTAHLGCYLMYSPSFVVTNFLCQKLTSQIGHFTEAIKCL